jgi:hypothetical protein
VTPGPSTAVRAASAPVLSPTQSIGPVTARQLDFSPSPVPPGASILHPGWCGRGAAHPDGLAHPHGPIVFCLFRYRLPPSTAAISLERHHLSPLSSPSSSRPDLPSIPP